MVAGIAGLNRIDTTTLAPAQLPLVMANEILGPLPEGMQERLARALIEVHVPAGDYRVPRRRSPATATT